jgi:hypothetical protein
MGPREIIRRVSAAIPTGCYSFVGGMFLGSLLCPG